MYESRPIESIPGVEPVTDTTEQATRHAVYADKIRYVDGFPQKIGGWNSFPLQGIFDINGCPRMLFSYILDNQQNYIIGTSTNLYYVTGADLTNITPVVTSPTGVNNDFSTVYGTLASNPITTVSGSNIITVADAQAARFREGDTLVLSGSSAVNGIPDTEINANQLIFNVTSTTYQIEVTSNASSSGAGGGASVVRAARLIEVTLAITDAQEGDNVEIDSAGSAVGGIPDTEINGIHQIRNVTGSTFDFSTTTAATSSVSATGGMADAYEEIPDGPCDAIINQGYGLNLYGIGLYGVPKTALNPTPPRLWSADRYGDLIITTPGGQTGLYSWDSDIATLPELVSGAPTAINYCFTSDNIAVTLGAGGQPNRIKWSDQGVLTDWTATAQNQAGEDDIEGAGEFISHCSLRGFNLIFTRNQVYTFRYLGKPFVWETKQLDPARGLIAQNARIVVNGVAYWMGQDNFYMYRGGNVEIIPSNDSTQATIKEYVFQNVNLAQKDKIFCWYNQLFNEIWWHYPADSTGADNPDRIARLNVLDLTWVPDTLNRTAGEYPTIVGSNPYLIDIEGTIYQHETGTDDDGQPLAFRWDSAFYSSGSRTINLQGFIPDSTQTGDISVSVITKRYPQTPTPTTNGPYSVSPTTQKISYRRSARYWQYRVEGSELGQIWRAGAWAELFNQGTPL